MNWYLGVIKNYAVFNGRARRKEFWLYNLIKWLICIALVYIEALARTILNMNTDGYLLLVPLYLATVLLPSMAVSVRRLHDINRSGWKLLWALLPGGIFVLLSFYLQKGNMDSNKYGPNPKIEE